MKAGFALIYKLHSCSEYLRTGRHGRVPAYDIQVKKGWVTSKLLTITLLQ